MFPLSLSGLGTTDSTTGRTLIKVLEKGVWREIVFIEPPIVADLTKWLVKKGADVHATDNDGKTALMHATEAKLCLASKYLSLKMKN